MKAPKGLLPGEIPKHLNFVSGTARYFDAYNADFNFTLKKWQSKKNIKDIQAMKYNSASWIIKFSFTSSQKFVNSTRKHRPWLLPGNVAGACESSRWMATLIVCTGSGFACWRPKLRLWQPQLGTGYLKGPKRGLTQMGGRIWTLVIR